jgi:hypothetical protein
MRRTATPIFVIAVVASVLLHLTLVVSPTAWWAGLVPAAEVVFPIDAVLADDPAPTVAIPPALALSAPSPVAAPPVVDRPPVSAPISAPVTPPHEGAAAPVEMPVVSPVLLPPPAPLAPVAPVTQPSARLAPPARPVQRDLPKHLNLTYAVRLGDLGFKAGQMRLVWVRQGARYSLVGTVEATGVTALFVSGRIVQVSEGEIAADGLRPSRYWLQRGERKQDQVRFDWTAQQLNLGAETVALPVTAQDLLTFPFHLAMTARSDETSFVLPVTNGRKLKDYRIQSLGVERVEEREAWHLQGSREGEGTLDVWLDMAKGGLPVQIRTQDAKGKVMLLTLDTAD